MKQNLYEIYDHCKEYTTLSCLRIYVTFLSYAIGQIITDSVEFSVPSAQSTTKHKMLIEMIFVYSLYDYHALMHRNKSLIDASK